MRKLITVASILIAAFFAAPLNLIANGTPGQKTLGINRRQNRQSRRVMRGVRSGSLTRRETARLARQQARIRAHERHAKSDGVITARERGRIQRQENRASRNIYRKKHNRR